MRQTSRLTFKDTTTMTTRTIIGLYETYEAASRTVRDLEAAYIPDADISLVAHRFENFVVTDEPASGAEIGAETGAAGGAAIGGAAGLLAGLGVLAIPGVGPVVAAGWLVAAAAGAVAGAVAGGATGGLIGSLTSAGVSKEHASFYAEGVRRGGALVTARVEAVHIATTEAIMQRNGRIDPVTREKAYRDSGWREFDEKSVPFTQADVARERTLYPILPLI
jgi:hypothetical protein